MLDKNNVFVTQYNLFGNKITQNTLFYSFYVDGWKKNITYGLGENEPGSAKIGEYQQKVEPCQHVNEKDLNLLIAIKNWSDWFLSCNQFQLKI